MKGLSGPESLLKQPITSVTGCFFSTRRYVLQPRGGLFCNHEEENFGVFASGWGGGSGKTTKITSMNYFLLYFSYFCGN